MQNCQIFQRLFGTQMCFSQCQPPVVESERSCMFWTSGGQKSLNEWLSMSTYIDESFSNMLGFFKKVVTVKRKYRDCRCYIQTFLGNLSVIKITDLSLWFIDSPVTSLFCFFPVLFKLIKQPWGSHFVLHVSKQKRFRCISV